MKNNSDPMYKKHKNIDFTDAKPVSAVPALAKLQAESGDKSRITDLNAALALLNRKGGEPPQEGDEIL